MCWRAVGAVAGPESAEGANVHWDWGSRGQGRERIVRAPAPGVHVMIYASEAASALEL